MGTLAAGQLTTRPANVAGGLTRGAHARAAAVAKPPESLQFVHCGQVG